MIYRIQKRVDMGAHIHSLRLSEIFRYAVLKLIGINDSQKIFSF
jgi:hypothetical protein